MGEVTVSIHQAAAGSTRRSGIGAGWALAGSMAVLAVQAVLFSACATSGSKPSRLHLGNQAYLEALLPANWSWEPTMVSGPRLSLLRLFARNPETTQMRIIPRPEFKVPTAFTAEQARALAVRDLAASQDCDGLGSAMQDRRLSQGFAFYCSQPLQATLTAPSSLLPTTAGVLVLPGLVARFAILGVTGAENNAAWSILQSLQVASFVHSP